MERVRLMRRAASRRKDSPVRIVVKRAELNDRGIPAPRGDARHPTSAAQLLSFFLSELSGSVVN
jgi:hypothetical protein